VDVSNNAVGQASQTG